MGLVTNAYPRLPSHPISHNRSPIFLKFTLRPFYFTFLLLPYLPPSYLSHLISYIPHTLHPRLLHLLSVKFSSSHHPPSHLISFPQSPHSFNLPPSPPRLHLSHPLPPIALKQLPLHYLSHPCLPPPSFLHLSVYTPFHGSNAPSLF